MIKRENIVHCLMQYSKSYGNYPKILIPILHGYRTQQFQKFSIPPTWLSYVTASKYCYSWYGFLTHIFKTLPTFHMEFFWIGNPNFLEIGRHYMSIIIKFFWYFIPVSLRRLLQVAPSAFLSPLRFSQVCLLFYKKYFINLLLLWADYLWNIMHFQSKNLFLSTDCWSVLNLLFCLYVFMGFFTVLSSSKYESIISFLRGFRFELSSNHVT